MKNESFIANLLIGIMRIWFAIMFKVEIKGKENVPAEGNAIICANHYSNYDPFAAAIYLDRLPRYIGKKELFENKVLAFLLKEVRVFPLDRKAAMDMKAVKTALKVLKDGEILGIFAEGTRVKEGEHVDAKGGVALFAMKGNASVIPCAISGKYKFRNKITVEYGAPLSLDEFRGQKLTAEVMTEITDVIMGKVEEMKVKA
ncbi:lysophospholipid acyltransferase family protein [Anaerotignum sp.]